MRMGNIHAPLKLSDLPGLRVTVMGLGLHGGGAASAGFFAAHGCTVTVTDMKDERFLEASLRKLDGRSIRYVLGRHEMEDFTSADLVIKNPAVPPDNPYLSAAFRVETDISVFLALCNSPVLAVTGTKGKSTTVSALHCILKSAYPEARIGGNITVSPLEFLDDLLALPKPPPVALELSSWQLGDLKNTSAFKPNIAAITNIMPDHQNRYAGMDDYVADKKFIYRYQDREDITLCNFDDSYGGVFASETGGRVRYFSQFPLPKGTEGGFLAPLKDGGERKDGSALKGYVRAAHGDAIEEIVPSEVRVPGIHGKLNLLIAGLMAYYFGIPAPGIRKPFAVFPGVEHRLEYAGEVFGARIFNDSAATIPEAVVAAVGSFSKSVILIMGGTDKKLDFSPLMDVSFLPEHIILLNGSAAGKITDALRRRGLTWSGPFDSFQEAVEEGLSLCSKEKVLVFSPGCASFEMFQNEFDRGRRFKEIIAAATGRTA